MCPLVSTNTLGSLSVFPPNCLEVDFALAKSRPLALVAQRIEQKTSNLLVAGSIPAEGAVVSGSR